MAYSLDYIFSSVNRKGAMRKTEGDREREHEIVCDIELFCIKAIVLALFVDRGESPPTYVREAVTQLNSLLDSAGAFRSLNDGGRRESRRVSFPSPVPFPFVHS